MKTLSKRQVEIIEAAGQLISSGGMSGLTIKNIAKSMDFAESAVYRHFASKEEIVVSMLNFLADDMDRRYQDLSLEKLGTLQAIEAIFLRQMAYFNHRREFVGVLFPDGLLDESHEINAAIRNLMALRKNYLLPLIITGQQEGKLNAELEPEVLGHILMGSFRLLVFQWRMAGFSFDLEEKSKELWNSLLIMITK